jgi:hypothetical protein
MIRDKGLFGFLQSRGIFTHMGVKTAKEAISNLEKKREFNNVARHPRKKAKRK